MKLKNLAMVLLLVTAGCGDKDEEPTNNRFADDCTVNGCDSPLQCDEVTRTCQPVKCENDGDCDALTEYCDDGPGTCRELVLYRTCDFPAGSACSGSSVVSCVLPQDNDDCIDTAKQCATYEMSATFCTKRCNSDEDCDGGTCTEIVSGTNELYCVAPTN